jgi:uncharacterized Rmd1/YagE family protein
MKVVAFSTAEEYNLDALVEAIKRAPGFDALPELACDVIHVRGSVNPERSHEGGDLFVFGDGSFVVWGQDADQLGRTFLARVLHKPVPGLPVPPQTDGSTFPIEVFPLSKIETEEMDYIEDVCEYVF